MVPVATAISALLLLIVGPSCFAGFRPAGFSKAALAGATLPAGFSTAGVARSRDVSLLRTAATQSSEEDYDDDDEYDSDEEYDSDDEYDDDEIVDVDAVDESASGEYNQPGSIWNPVVGGEVPPGSAQVGISKKTGKPILRGSKLIPSTQINYPSSIFDGLKAEVEPHKVDDMMYRVFTSNWTYVREDGETGAWDERWKMPVERFNEKKPTLFRRWRSHMRRERMKYGRGAKWNNGLYRYIWFNRDNPFTQEIYGEKYQKPMEWMFSPKEVKRKKQQIRANELKRKLLVEQVEARMLRLNELGIWTGDATWKKPWHTKKTRRHPWRVIVDLNELLDRKRREQIMGKQEGGAD